MSTFMPNLGNFHLHHITKWKNWMTFSLELRYSSFFVQFSRKMKNHQPFFFLLQTYVNVNPFNIWSYIIIDRYVIKRKSQRNWHLISISTPRIFLINTTNNTNLNYFPGPNELCALMKWWILYLGFDGWWVWLIIIESTISYNMDILALTYNMASYCVWRFFEIGPKVYIDSLLNVTMEMTS